MTADREDAVLMAADNLTMLLHNSDSDRQLRLAMQWPSLAAALTQLCEACGAPVPRPFRRAATAVHAEAEPTVVRVGDGAGAWCFCSSGASNSGHGHLKGEQGCGHWCRCSIRPHPHQHDGTMPGNPVIDDGS